MFRSTNTLFQAARYPLKTSSPPKIKGLYNLIYSLQSSLPKSSDPEAREKYLKLRDSTQTLSHYQRNALKRQAWHLYVHKMRSQLVRQETKRISLNDKKSIEQFKQFRRRVLEYRKKKRILSINNIIENEKYHDIIGMEKARGARERKQRRLNQLSIDETRRISGLKRLAIESSTFITPENIDAHIARELNPNKLLINTVFDGVRGVNDEVEYDLRIEEYFMNDLKDFKGAREFRDPLYPDARIYPFGGSINSDLDFVGPYEAFSEGQLQRLKEKNQTQNDKSTQSHDKSDPLLDYLYGENESESRPETEEKISREQQINEEDPFLGIYHEDINTPEQMKQELTQHYPYLEVHNKSIRRTKHINAREELLEKYKEKIDADARSESWGSFALEDNTSSSNNEPASKLLDDLFTELDKANKKRR